MDDWRAGFGRAVAWAPDPGGDKEQAGNVSMLICKSARSTLPRVNRFVGARFFFARTSRVHGWAQTYQGQVLASWEAGAGRSRAHSGRQRE